MIFERKILGSVGYVGLGSMPEPFTWAWGPIQFTNEMLNASEYNRGDIVNWMRGNQGGQIIARNRLAAEMTGNWLLMLDTDATFEPDILFRMLKPFNDNNLDVLTGCYTYKTYPHNPVLYGYSESKGGYEHIVRVKQYGPGECVRVGCAGAGALLVRRRVFERIASELRVDPFDPYGGYQHDDFSFFEKLRKLGIESWCCPSIQTFHLRSEETSLDDYPEDLMGVSEEIKSPMILRVH